MYYVTWNIVLFMSEVNTWAEKRRLPQSFFFVTACIFSMRDAVVHTNCTDHQKATARRFYGLRASGSLEARPRVRLKN